MALKKAEAPEGVAPMVSKARNAEHAIEGAEERSAACGQTKAEGLRLIEAVVERGNMRLAYQRVVGNKGAPGVDGLTVVEFKGYLQTHWPSIRVALLEGRYVPQPVRRADIPKPSGGVRTLGIPTVLDRLIQQALNQVLQPMFDPEFSESSYGFRPGRNAHQAVTAAQAYVAAGKRWVVDIDLEKFFDRVNHDRLMAKLAARIGDERVLKLIRRYLEAGLMHEGLVSARREGTPQGGPLSPLLSNIVLAELDRELERRGHAFCRYADDCNIYVGSRRSGERVMRNVTEFVETTLKLKVNAAKSAVAQPWRRTFLGYTLTWHDKPKLRIAKSSLARFADKVRDVMTGARGRSLKAAIEALNPLLRGWINYFRLTQTKQALESLDGWLRRKLRCLLWRQWKRASARFRHLRHRGLDEIRARCSVGNGRGPWWNSSASHMHSAFPKSYFDALGLLSLLDTQRRLQRTS